MEVLNWARAKFRVDEKRIHITGLSMGGAGTWSAIQDYPELFATASPVCGAFNAPSKACRIASENLPVWAFHGDRDDVVVPEGSFAMARAIRACGGRVSRLTIYPDLGHARILLAIRFPRLAPTLDDLAGFVRPEGRAAAP